MTSELAPEQHPGVLSELNYFSPQFFQNNIVSEYTRTFLPQSAPTHDTPIEFHIESSSGVFLDLNDTDFEVRLRIVHRNGTALAAGEQCAPANQILHTMWKSVELYMNGTQVSEAHALYPYLAYMSTLTNYGADVQTTRLLSAGWTKIMATSLTLMCRLTLVKTMDCFNEQNGSARADGTRSLTNSTSIHFSSNFFLSRV